MTGIAEMVLRLVLGALLGGIIGFERYTHGRPAGFRTHIIVCVASVLIMMVSVDSHYLTKQNPDYIRIDPSRIAAGAITGIGFLGAGVIIKTGFIVQGLTTAACLWIVSAIGLAVGVGLYLPGIIATFITMIALWFLRGIEHKMEKRVFKQVGITTDNDDKEQIVEETLREAKADITNINYEYNRLNTIFNYTFTISVDDREDLRGLLARLRSIDGISRVSIKG
jgi:putative Mg2+ transporter-C (MgtC) family protein